MRKMGDTALTAPPIVRATVTTRPLPLVLSPALPQAVRSTTKLHGNLVQCRSCPPRFFLSLLPTCYQTHLFTPLTLSQARLVTLMMTTWLTIIRHLVHVTSAIFPTSRSWLTRNLFGALWMAPPVSLPFRIHMMWLSTGDLIYSASLLDVLASNSSKNFLDSSPLSPPSRPLNQSL